MLYGGGKEARDEMFHFLMVRGFIVDGLNCPEEFVVTGAVFNSTNFGARSPFLQGASALQGDTIVDSICTSATLIFRARGNFYCRGGDGGSEPRSFDPAPQQSRRWRVPAPVQWGF